MSARADLNDGMVRQRSVKSSPEMSRQEVSPSRRRRTRRNRQAGEPVAILGLATRLPGGIKSPEEFWQALATGTDLIGTVPRDRWDASAFYSADTQEPCTVYDVHGGFLSDIDAFDAAFFRINGREAAQMDPQHRLLLELTWEALERSAIDPRSLMDSQTGIWIGLSNAEYGRLIVEDPRRIDCYTGVAPVASIASGRIAYFLGTHGPAEVVDTACSSSLVAIHRAMQSLRQGESNLAIVGAVNLMLSPEVHMCFSRTGMLSRTGRCHTFDSAADGYVRSEACCVFVLKRLRDAQRDHDRVLAVIRGSAVNHNGRSAAITASSVRAQEAVMRAALADAGLEPQAVDYVEAHGTGTPLGDPMEFLALGAVYGTGRTADRPLQIGSVKTNMGHAESAAGLAGLAKVTLMLQPGAGIPPHLHLMSPNPRIRWKRWPLNVASAFTAWPDAGVRRVGLSCFGYSGTNAHVIVESSDSSRHGGDRIPARHPREALLCLSAQTEEALRHLAQRYAAFLATEEWDFPDICDAAATTRAQLECRLAIKAADSASAAALLQKWLADEPDAAIFSNRGPLGAEENRRGRGALDRVATAFVAGEKLQFGRRSHRAVQIPLPVYPFQATKYWFDDPPQLHFRRDRERVAQKIQIEAERQSLQAPVGWNPENIPAQMAVLSRLTLAHARNVLIAAGAFRDGTPTTADRIMTDCGFLPLYRSLIWRWLHQLARAGLLVEHREEFQLAGTAGMVDLEPLWKEVDFCLQDEAGMLRYIKHCGRLLPEVLQGRVNALETLFPGGSFDFADAVYAESGIAQYTNGIIAAVLRTAVEGWGQKRNVRILEAGAGTGGATSAALPLLDPSRTEYWFTDVSEFFIHRARKEFAGSPCMRYATLDLGQDLRQQNWQPHRFDVVLAANVVHAVPDLPAALDRLHELLAPGGILILLEGTVYHDWYDMTFALLEGWQNFQDGERTDHPLLSREKWLGLLRNHGFGNISALPANDSVLSSIGQHVILAQNQLETEPQPASEVFARKDKRGRAEAPGLRSLLQQSAADQRYEVIVEYLQHRVAEALGLHSSGAIGTDQSFGELGMDSLVALELKNQLQQSAGVDLPAHFFFEYQTVGQAAAFLNASIMEKESDAFSLPAPIYEEIPL